jgi:hypothetical protein
MILTSMTSFLFGAALAQRFNLVVLLPATAIVTILSVGAGAADIQAAWWIAAMAVVSAICLQCGYFAGIFIRHLAAPSQESTADAGAEASTHPAAH